MKAFTLLLFAVLLTGAKTMPQVFETGNSALTDENLNRVKAGMQINDVKAFLGSPEDIIELENGSAEWNYRQTTAEVSKKPIFREEPVKILAKLLTLTVNEDGMITNMVYDEMTEKKE